MRGERCVRKREFGRARGLNSLRSPTYQNEGECLVGECSGGECSGIRVMDSLESESVNWRMSSRGLERCVF